MKSIHSRGYMTCFVFMCIFSAIKLAALVFVAVEFALLLSGGSPQEDVISRSLFAFLADFVSLIAVWLFNRKVKLLPRAASIALLCSPLLWVGVLAVSFLADPYAASSIADIIGFCLIGAALLLPDTLLALGFLGLRSGLPEEYIEESAPTLSERIRAAKK